MAAGLVADAVLTAHSIALDLCGDGPALGFVATGEAARVCQQILQQAFHDNRGLSETDDQSGKRAHRITSGRSERHAFE